MKSRVHNNGEKIKSNISCSNSKWNQESSQEAGGEVQTSTELLQMAKVNLGPWGGESREGRESWNPAAILQLLFTNHSFPDDEKQLCRQVKNTWKGIKRHLLYKFVIFSFLIALITEIQRNRKNVKRRIKHFKPLPTSPSMIREKITLFGIYFSLFWDIFTKTWVPESTLFLLAPMSTQTEPQANKYFSCLR